MSDLAAGCPDCKKHQAEITMLEERIKQLESQCGSLNRGHPCMLKPGHAGSHRFWNETTSLAWN